jgi:N-glycosylase/DNA lyase
MGFDVRKIFDCGQCFRFEPVENTEHEAEFSGIAHGRFISVAQDGSDIYIYNASEAEYNDIWRCYLALDADYAAIDREILSLSDNEKLRSAVEYGNGIRILRQEPWEAICSFIVSQNNNIPRIKKIIEAMARECGEPIEIPEGMREKLSPSTAPYAFPTPSALLSLGVDGIFALKTGFRAKYIYDAAEKFARGEIDCEFLRESKSTGECIEHLSGIKGVGPKVACCALLFGFSRYDAFPIDVWIKKVIEKYFGVSPEKFSPATLGEYAGIAQQYLFYYERYCGGRGEAV